MPNTSHKNEITPCKSRGNSTLEEKIKRNDLLANILSGDLGIVRNYFFYMFGKGYFRVMKQRLTSDQLNLWVDDLSQEVFFEVYSKIVRGEKIEFVKSFVFKIILYQSYDEDRRLARLDHTESLGSYEYKDLSFEEGRYITHDTY